VPRGACLLAVCISGWLSEADAISVFGMLTKWTYITRLETRTKETIMFASIWVEKPACEMKVIDAMSQDCSIDRAFKGLQRVRAYMMGPERW